jgi:hypothetical protein
MVQGGDKGGTGDGADAGHGAQACLQRAPPQNRDRDPPEATMNSIVLMRFLVPPEWFPLPYEWGGTRDILSRL